MDFAIDKIRHSMVRIKSEIRSRSANQPFSGPFPTAALRLLILLMPSVGPSGVIRFTREGHRGGRARLLPSWRRIGSAGASPSRSMHWLEKVETNMFTGVERGSCRAKSRIRLDSRRPWSLAPHRFGSSFKRDRIPTNSDFLLYNGWPVIVQTEI